MQITRFLAYLRKQSQEKSMQSLRLPRPTGMKAFYTLWAGQFLSLLGTGMSRFALTLWAWEITGSATALALVAFFSFAPSVILSPIAGALVDRWDKKLTMMLSDLAAGAGTVILFFLSLNGVLDIWHVYIVAFFTGAFESFQFPAYSSAISTMVDKEQYTRTSGMLSLAGSVSEIFAPIGAAALFGLIHLNGLLLIDIVSFLFAYVTLLLIHIPAAKRSEAGADSRRGGFFGEVLYGFRFIWERKSLFGLQSSFFFANFFFAMTGTISGAMILARTANDEAALAAFSTSIGIGGVVGGILVSTWGGLKERRVRGVMWGFVFSGLLGTSLMGLGQSIFVWVIAGFLSMVAIPLLNSSNQAIWQSKVPPDVQGKVFSARAMIARISAPLAMILGGLLADYVFEPAMQAGGTLAPIFGGIFGVGDGAGMALMFAVFGICSAIVGIIGYSIPLIREVESRIPDFDAEEVEAVA
jgi:DHA3 family macrolide efflux protein-like MFS transporter